MKRGSIIGYLSTGVLERRMPTGTEAFSLKTRLDDTTFVLPSVCTLIKTMYLKICAKSLPKHPFPVAVRRSKTPLLKLANDFFTGSAHLENFPWQTLVGAASIYLQAIPNFGKFLTPIKEEHFTLQAFNSRKLRSDALLGSFEVLYHYLCLLLFNYLRVAVAAFSNVIWSLYLGANWFRENWESYWFSI